MRALLMAVDVYGLAIVLQAILGLTGLFSIILFVLFRRTVSKPILALSADMTRLADGQTDITCTGAGLKDEIGTMAAAVEVFRKAAIADRQLEADAERARRQAEADRLTAQRQAEADAAERLQVAISGLANGHTGDLLRRQRSFASDGAAGSLA